MENNKEIELKAKELTDETVSKMIEELDPSASDIPDELQNAMLRDFKKYMEKDEEISQELERLQKEYQDLLKQNEEEFSQLMQGMNIKTLISKLENLSKVAGEIGNIKAVKHYEGLITELKSSVDLNLMFKSIGKIQNPSKVVQQTKVNFDSEMKKFRNKLAINQKYYFNDPANLLNILSKHIDEETAKIFLYSLSRFINVKGQERISQYSIFISQLIKNIYAIDEDFESKDDLIQFINIYVNELKG
jgi:hypothetical protein